MSYNQSRPDRNETHYRQKGRSSGFNQQRPTPGGYGRGAGTGPAPSPSNASSNSQPLPSNRGYKKSNNAQGGQPRPVVNSPQFGNASAPGIPQNGDLAQNKPQGVYNAPRPAAPAVPKVPTSQSATTNPANTTSTPTKAPGDASKAFPLQFGSISPGCMNGAQDQLSIFFQDPLVIQSEVHRPVVSAGQPDFKAHSQHHHIPARTSSAPPNLDEQKRDQARSALNFSTLVPKQQSPRKDMDPSKIVDAQKAKKDVQISYPNPQSQLQKPPVLPIPMASMQMPFQPPQASMQFGGPNPQLQSQGVTATSLQMPMPMPMQIGNAPQVQQQVYVTGLQSHPMPQGLMHQGQGMSFTTPMGGQLPPQLGHIGLGMTPQYPQQQGNKFAGPRKTTVKITHPDTREELRLDKRAEKFPDSGLSGPRSQHNIPNQSQPVPPFTAPHAINYYPNSYTGPIFFPPSSLPLTSGQMTPSSQAPRFNYPVTQVPQNVMFVNQLPRNSVSVTKPGPSAHGGSDFFHLENSRDVHNHVSSVPSGASQVTIKPAVVSVGKKAPDSLSSSSVIVEKVGSPRALRPSGKASLSTQRDAVSCSENSSQQLKHGSESVALAAELPSAAAKTPMVVAAVISSENLASNPAAPLEDSLSPATTSGNRITDSLSELNSIKSHKTQPGKGHVQPLQQVSGQASDGVSSSSQTTVDAATVSSSSSPISDGVKDLDKVSPPVDLPADDSSIKTDIIFEGSAHVSSQISRSGIDDHTSDLMKLGNSSLDNEELKLEKHIQDDKHSEISSELGDSNCPELVKQTEQALNSNGPTISNRVQIAAAEAGELDSSLSSCPGTKKSPDSTNMTTSRDLNSADSVIFHGDKDLSSDVCLSGNDGKVSHEVALTKGGLSDQQSVSAPNPDLSLANLNGEGGGAERVGGGSEAVSVSALKDKTTIEENKAKVVAPRGKKKRKEILQKADAAGLVSDLYVAYKGDLEKKAVDTRESVSVDKNLNQASPDGIQGAAVVSKEDEKVKAEPDDWEDAADVSTPNLETSDDIALAKRGLLHEGKDGNEIMSKKYSRDFILKFSEQCTHLPEGFEIASDIADALMSVSLAASHLVDRDSYPSPGRGMERSNSRVDRRGNNILEDDRWNRPPGGPFNSGRDPRMDMGYGGNLGFRPAQGANYGVLRNPRPQSPIQYAGGILSGPVHSIGSQGGMGRNNPDADRWQRAPSFQQKGLMPYPQTPLLMMHKAEKKYEVGKVTDEEQAKQRRLKGILNKLTPQNFEKLFEQVKEVNIDNVATLTGVISQIFDKALMEPTFCEMYANFCCHLSRELPDLNEDNEKITFRRLLLNKCQEEFERGEREEEEANRIEEGEVKQTEEEREEKRIQVRRRMLGNIRLIGELYKMKMLTERIMHSCIVKLLGQNQNPDEENIEALCKLMSTIGEMIDHPKAKEHIDYYFQKMTELSKDTKLSSRVRFMLRDSIDLRKNKWQQRRKVEGPKKIEEVHRDAAQERQTQTNRLARGPGINPSPRRGAMDFGSRGSSMLSSPNPQLGGFRGYPSQARGFGAQDARFDERPHYEARPSTTLPQRSLGDGPIILGPQGGLGRGMSIRAPVTVPANSVTDFSQGMGESRRMSTGLNGYSPVSETTAYSSRDDTIPRFVPDRFTGSTAYEPTGVQERGMNYSNRDPRTSDFVVDRPVGTSPRVQGEGSLPQKAPIEKVLSEESMSDMSVAAIKEYYSARDEKEVALCIREINSPSFHPTMISLWVTDSFERKDMERDLLSKLLISLAKSPDGIFSHEQLIKGFESVLATLEDAVNDAPKAAEFLGRIFGKVIVENVSSLRDIGSLIHKGGEEPGRLLEIGLAGDVLGSTLAMIKAEKGEGGLKEIRLSSNLRFEDFRPPEPCRSKLLDNFI